ncbi:MAG: septum site-determining protein MinC [Burkholderiaceae bacterium]
MVVARQTNTSPIFELKSAALTLVAVQLKTTDLEVLALALEARFADAPELFDQDPVAIDLSLLREADEAIDFDALVTLLRSYKMQPIAAKAGSAAQMEAALAAGLTEAHGTAQASPPAPAAVLAEAVPVAVETPAAPHTALIVDKPLRSGQRVYAKGGDLIVLAVVSFGAEVIADGNIHVYAPLRGRALAGALGNTSARIFTTCMEAQLLSIAGIYRTTETELPAAVLGKTAQVWLDGESLVVEALKF